MLTWLRLLVQWVLSALGLGRSEAGTFTVGGAATSGDPNESGGPVADPITKPEVTAATSDISDGFFDKLAETGAKEGWDPRLLLPVMAHESGLKADAYNPNGPAYGLIQFFGPKWSFIRSLTAEQQEPYIEGFYKAHAPYKSVGEVYGETFVPARMVDRGRAPSTVLAEKGEAFYDQNPSLDFNHDGAITIQDLEDVANAAAKGLGKRYTESLARLTYAMGNLGGGSGVTGSGFPWGPLAVGGVLIVFGALLLRKGS